MKWVRLNTFSVTDKTNESMIYITVIHTSATGDWNFICSSRSMTVTSECIMWMGVMAGAVFFGMVADKVSVKIIRPCESPCHIYHREADCVTSIFLNATSQSSFSSSNFSVWAVSRCHSGHLRQYLHRSRPLTCPQ